MEPTSARRPGPTPFRRRRSRGPRTLRRLSCALATVVVMPAMMAPRARRARPEVGRLVVGATVDRHVAVAAREAVAGAQPGRIVAQVLVDIPPAAGEVEVQARAVGEAEQVAVVVGLGDRGLFAVAAPAVAQQAAVGGAVALHVLVEPGG